MTVRILAERGPPVIDDALPHLLIRVCTVVVCLDLQGSKGAW